MQLVLSTASSFFDDVNILLFFQLLGQLGDYVRTWVSLQATKELISSHAPAKHTTSHTPAAAYNQHPQKRADGPRGWL